MSTQIGHNNPLAEKAYRIRRTALQMARCRGRAISREALASPISFRSPIFTR